MIRSVTSRLPSLADSGLALLAAGLLTLAFPDFEYWFLAYVALVPLLIAIERSQVSTVSCFLIGWLFGTAFFIGTCWWLTYAPIHYASVPWPIAYALILIACIGAGIFPAIFAAVLSILFRRFGSWAFLAAPFVWVFSEFLRYWLTGNNWNAIGYSQAFTWGGQAPLSAQVGGVYLVGFTILTANALFAHAIRLGQELRARERAGDVVFEPPPNELVALELSDDPGKLERKPRLTHLDAVIPLTLGAYLFPVYALFFLFVNVLHDYGKELQALRIKNLRTLLIVVLLPVGFSAFVWLATAEPGYSFGRFSIGDAFVTAVQPNVPMSGLDSAKLQSLRDRQTANSLNAFEENLERYRHNDLGILDNVQDDEYAELVRERFYNKPRTIILPESPMNFMYNDDREFQSFIHDFARRNNVSVLFNSAEPDRATGKFFNSAVMVSPEGGEAAQYDKIYLLPFGEAVPPVLEGIVPGFVGNFAYGSEYDLLPFGDAKGGVMICFESHFGQLSREFVRDGADVLIEMTNDGYLGPTPVLRQHLANAVFRAVETNRPVIRVTNVGVTAYINERGEVLDEAVPYTEATRVWGISKSDGSQTFYVKYGDWFAWLCTLVTLGLLILSFRRRSSAASA